MTELFSFDDRADAIILLEAAYKRSTSILGRNVIRGAQHAIAAEMLAIGTSTDLLRCLGMTIPSNEPSAALFHPGNWTR